MTDKDFAAALQQEVDKRYAQSSRPIDVIPRSAETVMGLPLYTLTYEDYSGKLKYQTLVLMFIYFEHNSAVHKVHDVYNMILPDTDAILGYIQRLIVQWNNHPLGTHDRREKERSFMKKNFGLTDEEARRAVMSGFQYYARLYHDELKQIIEKHDTKHTADEWLDLDCHFSVDYLK